MSEYTLCECNQSAYKLKHGAETALVCVQNDILRVMDNQNIVIMLLMDLLATVDAVDHDMVLHRLSHDVAVVQTALNWVTQFNLSTLMVVRHLLALLCVGSLKVLYSVRSCFY